ncbi:MAG: hypothetical protein L3J83_04855 [Proteobacteria bacterium]|nr:hypothetical protein [Pseudomonadota bacterium]
MLASFLKGLTPTQKQSLIIALMLAFVAKKVPILSIAFNAYNTAVHEVGHAFTAWIFGYIAIPSFDYINGGGVTRLFSRPLLLCLIAFVFVVINLLLINQQIKTNSKKVVWIGLIVYSILFFSQLHRLLITYMGIGGEILISFVIAWYALFNLKDKIKIKHLLYLFLSMSIFQNTTNFIYSLLFDAETKTNYIEGKQQILENSALTNDLVKLTESTGFSINFFSWSLLFLTVLAIYKILRINQLPKLSNHFFKGYFQSLWIVAKEIKDQSIKKINRR